MRKKQQRKHTARRYALVRKDYKDWIERIDPVTLKRIYTNEYVFAKLAIKYFLSERRIEDIVYNRV
jgi:hypothetical protein